jgi:cytoskeletal protein RodZ
MTDKMPLEKNAEEKLGEYLKRARLAAGIDQAELAREIRITPEMLDHLENGRYDKLPVQAYVRGYLNTICTRLELNRAKVLDWYAGEVGRNYSAIIATDQILIGNHEKLKSGDKGNGKLIMISAAAVLLVLVLIMNANNGGADSQNATRLADSLDSVAKAESLQTADTLQNSDTAGLSADSTVSTDSTDTVKSAADSASKIASAVETTLKFECMRDSTWVRVKKVGGLSWARLVHKGDKPRFVSHSDTMKVSIGSPEKTRLYINEEQAKIPGNYFKVLNGKILED